MDSPGRNDPGPSHAAESPAGNGGYAYSTTLRRQVSADVFPHFPHPHVVSPYSRGQHPLTGSLRERRESAHRDEGLLDKAVAVGRKLVGKKDYEELRMQQEEKRLSTERRQRETPSSIYAHKSVQVGPCGSVVRGSLMGLQETLDIFATHPTDGLANSAIAPLLARYGPNEFEVPPSDPLYLKFAKQVYENPLILLLLGSSVVSALMGQFDDAVCVIMAVTIVLTGKQYLFFHCSLR